MDSIRIYTKAALRMYDAVVMGLLARHVWGCPPDLLVEHYRQHVTSNHADIGVGTGYCLDRCGFAATEPRLLLIDLQPNCLEYAARRLARYHPQMLVRDVLEPMPNLSRRFDSVALAGVLHCLPGDMRHKAHAFDTLRPLTHPGSKIFGYSLVANTTRRRRRSDVVLHLLNRMRVVDNTGDRASELARELSSRFTECNVEQIGHMAFFSAVIQ
jgi:methyltransferase family protein